MAVRQRGLGHDRKWSLPHTEQSRVSNASLSVSLSLALFPLLALLSLLPLSLLYVPPFFPLFIPVYSDCGKRRFRCTFQLRVLFTKRIKLFASSVFATTGYKCCHCHCHSHCRYSISSCCCCCCFYCCCCRVVALRLYLLICSTQSGARLP